MRPIPFTSGPWVCHSGAVYQDGPTVWPKGPDTGVRIALMDRETSATCPTERDSNAILIAKAPELLHALRAMVVIAGYYPEMYRNHWEEIEAYSALLLAAEGKD